MVFVGVRHLMVADTLKLKFAAARWPSWLRLATLALVLPLLMQASPAGAQGRNAAAPAATPAVAPAQDYKLGPQDKLRLRVFEWRPTVDTVFEWVSLNAEFTVSASGMLSLPILGEVSAVGLTPTDLAKAIGERLKGIIGLAVAPNVAIEVTQYRPFYIMGGVNKPGEYPYRPGLTVLQALSVAGGLLGSGKSGLRIGRELITGKGDLQQYSTEIGMLLARKARLEAESAAADKIHFPAELEKRKSDPAVALLVQQEQSIFDVRRNALKTEIEALEQLKVFLAKEVESIQGQMKAQGDERDIIKKELENISSLVSRGLAVAPRQLELERSASRMEGDRLRLELTMMTAKQNISRTDISIIEARNKRSNEVANDLRETQTKLEIAVTKFGTAERLLYEAQYTAPQLLTAGQPGKYAPSYTIVRNGKEMQAADATPVEPGNSLKVVLPVPESVGLNPFGRAPTQ